MSVVRASSLAALAQPVPPRRGVSARLFGFVKGLLAAALVGAALLIVTWRVAASRLDEEIRARIETGLRLHYPRHLVSVASARRAGATGLEIRGVSISDPALAGEAARLAAIEEIFVDLPTDLAQLALRRPCVKRLVVRGAKIRASRLPDRSWSVSRLLPLPHFGGQPPKVVVERGEIVVLGSAGSRLLTMHDIHLETFAAPAQLVWSVRRADPDGPVVRVRGTLGGDQFRQMHIDGLFAPREGRWAMEGSIRGLEISPELWAATAAEIAARWSDAPSLQARADVVFRATNAECGDGHTLVTASGTLYEGKMTISHLPYPLTDLQARFRWENGGVRIDGATARCGRASLQAWCDIKGLQAGAPWSLRAVAQRLALDDQLALALPEALRALWAKFSPAGLANADLQLDFDGRSWKPELQLECLDVSLAYDRFPYRLRQGRGVVRLKDNVFRLEDFQAMAAGQTVRIGGEIRNPGPGSTGWVEVLVDEPIPLDESLLSALDEKHQRVVRSFDPGGMITFWGRMENDDPKSPKPRRRMRIGLHGCSIRYRGFPYPLNQVGGTLEMTDDEWTFRDLHGCNDSGYVTCQGVWTRKPNGGELCLEFAAKDVPLEDELRDALPPDSRRWWAGLRPRGVIDHLTVDVRRDSAQKGVSLDVRAQKWRPTGDAEGHSITVEPVWLPYRLENVAGAIRYRDGRVELIDVRAGHGSAEVRTEGICELNRNGDWSVRLTRLTADRVGCDRELVAALPGRLAQAVTKLNFSGSLHVDGSLSLAGGARPDSPATCRWDLLLDAENGGLDCGVRLDHIRGGVRLVGSCDERGFRSRGELAMDSVMFHQAQLTGVKGPLWMDQSQIVLGAGCPPDDSGGPQPSITAQVCGGKLALDARVALSGEPRFVLRCSLEDGDLSQVSQDFMAQPQNLTGKVFGVVQLSGALKGAHTWRGDGVVRLREADIYEVPLMVAMLSLLNLRPPEATAFTTADIDFRVQGDHVYFDRIDFHGDAITLRGSGDMDFQRRIGLKFYTMVGRDELQVPILRPVLGEASRQFLLIEVVGSLDQPKVRTTPFPGLNETLQQIFPEVAGADSVSLWSLPSPREALQRSSVWPRK